MKVKVYNLVILDESGSMQSIHKPAVDGLNETLQTIQSAQKIHGELQEHFVTMVFFNSNGIRTIVENRPVEQVKLLKMNDFHPNSGTPLYDAMGITLSRLRYQIDENEKSQVLITIITDGEENASREYSGKMIKNLVRDLKQAGWVFAYIGANQDIDEVADSMSIDNRMGFSADEIGSQFMAYKLNASRNNFYNKLSRSLFGAEVNLQEDFFEDEGKPKPE
ncbi:MAG: VWA domain-containing protein [Dysgonamonadaceae bacterium]|jgi:Mg-chelatase subunit ChlD|nr:VWA domain-containing protein [Dysgonamonadaceae bacterium]